MPPHFSLASPRCTTPADAILRAGKYILFSLGAGLPARQAGTRLSRRIVYGRALLQCTDADWLLLMMLAFFTRFRITPHAGLSGIVIDEA